MNKLFAIVLFSIMLLGLVACEGSSTIYPTEPETYSTSLLQTNEAEVEKIAYALFGAGMIGQTWAQNELENKVEKYSLAFTTFYCFLNPNYPPEIESSTYDMFIQRYFNVSTGFLHSMLDYDAENEIYLVSVDIMPSDAISAQIKEYFRIDSIEQVNDEVRVTYHILWGNMAAAGDGSDTAIAGNIVLKASGNYFNICSVNVTEDNSSKYNINFNK